MPHRLAIAITNAREASPAAAIASVGAESAAGELGARTPSNACTTGVDAFPNGQMSQP